MPVRRGHGDIDGSGLAADASVGTRRVRAGDVSDMCGSERGGRMGAALAIVSPSGRNRRYGPDCTSSGEENPRWTVNCAPISDF